MNPTLYDGRNLYYCLTNNYNYVFDVNKLDECIQIIDMLVIGIKNFIISLKDNIDIKVFIYYGEYNINHATLASQSAILELAPKIWMIETICLKI